MKYKFLFLILFLSFCFACSEKKQIRTNCSQICEKDLPEQGRILKSLSTEKQYDFAVSCTGEKVCCGDSDCTGFSAWVIRNRGVDSTILEKLSNESDKDAQLDFLKTFIILNNNHELKLKGRQDIAEVAGKVANEMTDRKIDLIFYLLGGKTRTQETKTLAAEIKGRTQKNYEE